MIFLLGAGLACGQQFSYGIFGGITASQVDGDSYRGFNKLGGTAGLFFNRHLNYNIYGQAEIKYVSRGVYKGPTDNDQTLYRSTYHYVEIPLSVHYLVQEKYFFELGSSPELFLAAAYADENGALTPEDLPDMRRMAISVFAGLGYWFSERMMAGIRYNYSAIPFRIPQEWNHPRYRGYYHNVISLSLAYNFRTR